MTDASYRSPQQVHDIVLQRTVRAMLASMAKGRQFRNFPKDYLVLDTETTGTDFRKDLIGQLGYCLVQDGRLISRGALLLDWTRHAAIDPRWLRTRLEICRVNVETTKEGTPTGKTYHLSMEKMAQDGAAPDDVLSEFLAWLRQLRQDNYFFVAHNGYFFDGTMLSTHFDRFLKESWEFDDYELYDTGMTEKAAQAGAMPKEDDTPKQFARMVAGMRLKGVRWSLDQHCVPKYGLDKVATFDATQAHDASHDCWMTHLLFEKYKVIAERADVDRGH